MVLIAASLSVALFLRFGFSLTDSAKVALGILTALSIYNTVAGRKNDRAEVSDQVSGLARGSSDIARQVAEFGRRLGAVESKLESVADRTGSAAQPLGGEFEEFSRLVRQLQHETELGRDRDRPPALPKIAAFSSLAG
jgi:cyclic-di-GMP phosphodiesterase, flagellum assembly factor TipF